ncbi:MAG: imidazolonepropionase [Oscillospiraceae bacterium]|nr:imidazolonepropionase [Oscillospiraceae bacterium]
METAELCLVNIGCLATPLGAAARAGAAQGEIRLLRDAAVAVAGGRVVYAGPAGGAPDAARVFDCGGRLVTPGLVDAHTHLIFGGWRQRELALRLSGASYLDILRGGGGILSTVTHTRAATEDALVDKGRALLGDMLRHGTTTCECKSGYGLDLETELKQLRAARRLQDLQPVTLVPTFLGAHAVPAEFSDRRADYVNFVCDVALPRVADLSLASFCDVFCDVGAFTADESARILARAASLGLGLKAHVDELEDGGGAALAARAGCVSAEHLIRASGDGIRALARAGVIACLLPATSFYLDKPYAPARDMVAAGVAVAVATDFNPGSSPNLNLQFAMQLACLRGGLTPEEVLTAATLNAAAALRLSGEAGTLEPGKWADLVLWNAPDLPYLLYRYGTNLVHRVVKNGMFVTARL